MKFNSSSNFAYPIISILYYLCETCILNAIRHIRNQGKIGMVIRHHFPLSELALFQAQLLSSCLTLTNSLLPLGFVVAIFSFWIIPSSESGMVQPFLLDTQISVPLCLLDRGYLYSSSPLFILLSRFIFPISCMAYNYITQSYVLVIICLNYILVNSMKAEILSVHYFIFRAQCTPKLIVSTHEILVK